MSKTYRIKPLAWVGMHANTHEGNYAVWPGAIAWFWASPYMLVGTKAESESAAKLAAEQHWHDRIAAALEEVGDE